MKKNFNVPVEESVSDEFDRWHSSLPGGKGEKLTAALKAIQALHYADESLVFKLMKPDLDIKQACDLILDNLFQIAYKHSLEKLNPQERSQVLKDALNSRQKASRKK